MALIAVGVSEEGYREVLGLKIALRETAESWRELLKELKERGLRRVEVATSDAHEGLEAALRETFPGCIWNRCQAHFRRNVLDKTPSGCRNQMKELLDSILEADSQRQAQQRLEEASAELAEEAPEAFEVLEDGLFEATAVLALPEKYRKRVRTTKHGRAAYPGASTTGETDSYLPEQGLGLASCWGSDGRKNTRNGLPAGGT